MVIVGAGFGGIAAAIELRRHGFDDVTVLERAIEIAAREDHIVVMGVQPVRAETGYGYIETGDKIDSELFRVKRFTERPNQQRAEDLFHGSHPFRA